MSSRSSGEKNQAFSRGRSSPVRSGFEESGGPPGSEGFRALKESMMLTSSSLGAGRACAREERKHLHRKGYPTTPSCTGHFYPEDKYRNIWHGIDSTCQKIRESGVCFLDPETGREYQCRDHNFQIPFTKKNFVHQAMQQGHKGVLGMFDPEEKIYTNLEQSMIPGTEIGRDDPLTLFLTHPQDEQELNSMWENFTDLVLQI